MKKMQSEIKIGLTIVIAMLVAIIGFRLMQDVPLFRPSLQLNTIFERVDGISPGSSVFMSGVKIGSVHSVILEGPDSVKVVMKISYTDGIPVGSVARIELADLIGSKSIRVYVSGERELIPDGGYIEGVYDHGMFADLEKFADEIKPDIKRTTGSMAEVLGQFEDILKDGGKEDVQQTLAALSQTSREMNDFVQKRRGNLDQSIVSLQNFLMNLDTLSSGRQTQLDSLLNNLETTSRELGVISGELSGVSTELNVMMQNINQGDGTLGKLIQDSSLYDNLDSLAINLKNISRRIEEDPGHFLKHMRLVDIF